MSNNFKNMISYKLIRTRHRLMSILPKNIVLKLFANEQEKNFLTFLQAFNNDDNFVVAGESRYSDISLLDHETQLDVLYVEYFTGGKTYSDAYHLTLRYLTNGTSVKMDAYIYIDHIYITEHIQSMDSIAATIKTSSSVFNHINALYKNRIKRNLKLYRERIANESINYNNKNIERTNQILNRIQNSDAVKVTRIG